jgi:pseudomonalisin
MPAAGSSTVAAGMPSPSAVLHLVPSVLAGLSLASFDGPAPAGLVLTIGVSVARPDAAGENALYGELYDPSSPLYHHFLTPTEFATEFGVSASDTSAIAAWLRSGGLQLVTSSPVGDYDTLTGTVGQLERLFRVTIGRYTYDGSTFVANTGAPSVPVNLPIDAVAGLDTFRKFTDTSLTPPRPPSSTPAAPSTVGTFSGIMTPRDLWGVYDDPPADEGQGQTIGIFTEGETDSTTVQLRLFEAAEGFPKVPVATVDTSGGVAADYGDNTGSVEWELDAQAAIGMAPKVSLLKLYTATSSYDAEVFQELDYWANDPKGPDEMNASFGECEENPTNPLTGPLEHYPYGVALGNDLEAAAEPILRQATIEGRTLFAAAGDNGPGCALVSVPVVGEATGIVLQPVPIVEFPADSPYVVGVGGTVVTTNASDNGQRVSETSWTYSGGGASHFIPEPEFQAGVRHVDLPCLSTPSGVPYLPTEAPICRGVPDVADMSGSITGNQYFIYIDSEPSSEGGTSLASPLMMGQWARIQAASASGDLGFADETIYHQAENDYTRDFYDITQSEYGVGNGVYRPGPGWDYASGWGSLNVANFALDVDGTDTARSPEAPTERRPKMVCLALGTSPVGNATDPIDVQLGNDPALDLTGVWLGVSKDGQIINAVLTGDDLRAPPPLYALAGDSYYVAWLYRHLVYYVEATVTLTGAVTYGAGDTGTAGDDGADATTGLPATGSVTNGYIHIAVPVGEVGSPPRGSFLLYPQAYDQVAGLPSEVPVAGDLLTDTVDRADDVVGTTDSIGDAVKVGGC